MTIRRFLQSLCVGITAILTFSFVFDLYTKQPGLALTAAVFASTFLALSLMLRKGE